MHSSHFTVASGYLLCPFLLLSCPDYPTTSHSVAKRHQITFSFLVCEWRRLRLFVELHSLCLSPDFSGSIISTVPPFHLLSLSLCALTDECDCCSYRLIDWMSWTRDCRWKAGKVAWEAAQNEICTISDTESCFLPSLCSCHSCDHAAFCFP